MSETTSAEAPNEERVRDILRSVVDPEIGLNIVDVGLIYRVDCTPDSVSIEMTMTSPACPMSEMIVDDAGQALAAALPENCKIEIELVWSPPWDPSMMSQRGKATLGW
jgi:metal-sulfur cluster biosynthetic enzyme